MLGTCGEKTDGDSFGRRVAGLRPRERFVLQRGIADSRGQAWPVNLPLARDTPAQLSQQVSPEAGDSWPLKVNPRVGIC